MFRPCRRFALALSIPLALAALAMTACGSPAAPIAIADDAMTSPTPTVPTATPTSQPTTTSQPTPTSAPSAAQPGTTSVDANPAPASGGVLLVASHELPDGFTPTSAAVSAIGAATPRMLLRDGSRTVVVGPDDTFSDSTLPLNTGDHEHVTAVLACDDTFLVATGHLDNGALLPDLFRWSTQLETWLPVTTSVTRPAAARAGFTPPSPPSEASSSILDWHVNRGVIHATGWALVDGTVVSALWTSPDGVSWQLDVIPTIGPGTEFGTRVRTGSDATLAAIGNWTYSGAGLLARNGSASWQPVAHPDPFPPADRFVRPVGEHGGTWWLGYDAHFGRPDAFLHAELAQVGNLDAWTELVIPTPPGREDERVSFGLWPSVGPIAFLHPAGDGEPVTVSIAWSPRFDRFVTDELPGVLVAHGPDWALTMSENVVRLWAPEAG